MDMVGECTNKVKINESKAAKEPVKQNYEDIIKDLPIFNKFVERISLEDYLKLVSSSFTLNKPDACTSQEAGFSLIESLSNAVCHPEVVDLITKKFLDNVKMND